MLLKQFLVMLIVVYSSATATAVAASDPFLANWMGQFYPLMSHLTLLDLSLPGTHDSLSYDLSTIVSEGGYDESETLSKILHFASEIGLTPGKWIRNQGVTQRLNVTEQLNNGIRFLDFRIMYSSTFATPRDWYSLHFVQSNKKALEYFAEIRNWLEAHPTEVVVLWVSKHGNECATGNNQFPGVPISEKRKYWASIEALFSGLLLDSVNSPLNSTSLETLLQRNQRVIIFASDYNEFTGNSRYAMDGCKIDNKLPLSMDEEIKSYHEITKIFNNSKTILEKDKAENKFFLMSLAPTETPKYLKYAFLTKYSHFFRDENRKNCASTFNIPNMSDWCPGSLLNISHLANYYSQINLDLAVNCDLDFPNAIYIDGLDQGGTILTGETLKSQNETLNTRFAYVDSLLIRNVKRSCQFRPHSKCE
ncbi:MAG: hypothetical protein ABIQ95_00370, partial [Bdellovibrionia bacterium]